MQLNDEENNKPMSSAATAEKWKVSAQYSALFRVGICFLDDV
jgi:hypothetical protein